jgi:DNA-binding IclR family transcriptional regulator
MTERLQASESHDGVAAVDRAFAVLAAIAAEAEPSTLAELSRVTGFYKSTILRLVASLENVGYVVRLHDGRYGLGASAFRLGLAYERQNLLRQHVLPILNDLVGRGTESASFHVLHGKDTRLCLFRINSHHATLDRVEAGNVLPLERGAAGRVLLAFSREGGTEQAALRREGYVLSRGERDPSCAGIAAPVFGPAGQLAGALSLSGPGERFTKSAVATMRALLLTAAAALTHALGGEAPRPAAKRKAG